jgi:formylglycine-generating enzyme required for sulfatase activity
MAAMFASTAGQWAKAATPDEFTDCAGATWCPQMVVIPSGEFLMGSPLSEKGRFDDESPQRRVKVRSFAVSKYDVTRAQYAQFVAMTHRPVAKGCVILVATKKPSWQDPGFAQGDDHPVVCVTWGDAQDYARWLSERTGKKYRLPSEAEWEYAARAGSKGAFPWGDKPSHEYANYGADTPYTPFVSGRDKWLYTSPVGSFPPNAFGLYDMHGNVSQWVQDCHADSYAKLPTDGSAFDPAGCKVRVARGGLWGDRADIMRSAARNYAPPDEQTTIADYRSSGFGFRVARTQ